MDKGVEIVLNKKWRLISDRYCWTLQRKYKKNGKDYYATEGYYATIADAIEATLEKSLKTSEAKSLKELLQTTEEIRKEIETALRSAKKHAKSKRSDT